MKLASSPPRITRTLGIAALSALSFSSSQQVFAQTQAAGNTSETSSAPQPPRRSAGVFSEIIAPQSGKRASAPKEQIIVMSNPSKDTAHGREAGQAVADILDTSVQHLIYKNDSFDRERSAAENSANLFRQELLHTLLETNQSAHVIVTPLSSGVFIGAYRAAIAELQGKEPLRWRELAARVHVVFLGGTPFDANFDRSLTDIGSIFRIRRVQPDGSRILDTTLNDRSIITELVPHLERRMLTESGEKVVTLKPERLPQVGDEKGKTGRLIDDVRDEREADGLRRGSQKLQKVIHELTIRGLIADASNKLEELRMEDYAIDRLEQRMTDVESGLTELERLQRIVDRKLDELAKRNAENEKIIEELRDINVDALSEIIQYLLTKPRTPAREMIDVRIPTDRPAEARPWLKGLDPKELAKDFDRDGVPDALEAALLARFKPVLALDDEDHRLPVNISEFVRNSRLVRADTDDPRLEVEDYWPSDRDTNGLWYGRVVQPDSFINAGRTDLYVVQYYSLFTMNTVSSSMGVTMALPEAKALVQGLTAGIIDIELGGDRMVLPIGGHEGDWICLNLLVRAPAVENPESWLIVDATCHNHGRQIFMEGASLNYWPGTTRPIVYAEYGSQELWPRPGEDGEDGFSKFVGTNEIKDDVFGDEDMIVHSHQGHKALDRLDVFNVGEVATSVGSGVPEYAGMYLPRLDEGGHLVRSDSRTAETNPDDAQRLSEMNWFFRYPLRWGGSDYRVKLVIQVPILGDIFGDIMSYEIKGHTFDSPHGPVQNSSADPKDSRARGVVAGKMWVNAFALDGKNVHDDARILADVSVEPLADGTGTKLSWPPIYGMGYVVVTVDENGRASWHLPGWTPGQNQESTVTGKRWDTSFIHDKRTGRKPGLAYRYSVYAVFGDQTRLIGNTHFVNR